MTDENGDFTYVNQTWVDWTNRHYQQNLGAGWMKAIIDADRDKVIERFNNDFTNRNLHEAEFRDKTCRRYHTLVHSKW